MLGEVLQKVGEYGRKEFLSYKHAGSPYVVPGYKFGFGELWEKQEDVVAGVMVIEAKWDLDSLVDVERQRELLGVMDKLIGAIFRDRSLGGAVKTCKIVHMEYGFSNIDGVLIRSSYPNWGVVTVKLEFDLDVLGGKV